MSEYEKFDTEELIEENARIKEQIDKLQHHSAEIERELARRGEDRG